MPTNNELISQKFNNYNYAPGIATYGIDGKTGITGNDGNNIYFTDFDIINGDSENLKNLLKLISNNLMPIKGSTVINTRQYKNDDLFFDYSGTIFKLIHFEDIDDNNQDVGVYSRYFEVSGKINFDDLGKYFIELNGRMVLNSQFSGYDILTGLNFENVSTYIDNDAALNIISDRVNENNDIEIFRILSIDSVDIENGDFSLYYKTTENTFYFDSNKPIVINSDLKVLNDNNLENEYDNFSTVLTSNDTITYFKHICDKLGYDIIYDPDTGKYNLVIYSTETDENALKQTLLYLIDKNETVFGKIYTGENDLILIHLNELNLASGDSVKYYEIQPEYDNNNLVIDASVHGKSTILYFTVGTITNLEHSYFLNSNYLITIDDDNNAYTKNVNISYSCDDDILQNIANISLTEINIIALTLKQNNRYIIGVLPQYRWRPVKGLISPLPFTVKDEIQFDDSESQYKFTFDGTKISKLRLSIEPLSKYELSNDSLDWSKYSWIDTDAGSQIYKELFKMTVANDNLHIVNIQKIGNNPAGIYTYFRLPVTNVEGCSYRSDNGAGIWINVENNVLPNKETPIKVTTSNGIETEIYEFIVYNDKGSYNILPQSDPLYEKYDTPIVINIDVPNELRDGMCTLYFERQVIVNNENNKTLLCIRHIQMRKEDYFLNTQSFTNKWCIISLIPDSIQSVYKFALLHNTEIFLDYLKK